jgi:urease accessory protein
MSDVGAILAALQYGDSFFPSGSVSFSWGLEGLAANGSVSNGDAVQGFVIGQLHARWCNCDRPVVVAGYRAGSSDEVAEIDDYVETATSAAELRSGSRRMGEAMLSVFGRLGFDAATTYRDRVKRGGAYAHLAVMQGYLWREAGLSEREAVALSAHTLCTALLGAGIRLGCITHTEAQKALSAAREEVARMAACPVPPIDQISSFAFEAEIAVMRHARNDTRMFVN